MNITDEYKRQANWRNWETYFEHLPIEGGHTVLDLGCGVGSIAKLLAERSSKVIGVDLNEELLATAELENNKSNTMFIKGDLRELQDFVTKPVNGIWSSFTAAYIPDFSVTLQKWLQLLKPNGWIALVEIDDLFGHSPIRSLTRQNFINYYDRQLKRGFYDFRMGGKLKSFLVKEGLTIIHEENKFDKEFTFVGPAEPGIYSAWRDRLNRMVALKEFLGNEDYLNLKSDFLTCLEHPNHSSETKVNYIIAQR
ncbi:MAG: class I SAM-dependent methyltransferase [Calditrichia bacterium]